MHTTAQYLPLPPGVPADAAAAEAADVTVAAALLRMVAAVAVGCTTPQEAIARALGAPFLHRLQAADDVYRVGSSFRLLIEHWCIDHAAPPALVGDLCARLHTELLSRLCALDALQRPSARAATRLFAPDLLRAAAAVDAAIDAADP